MEKWKLLSRLCYGKIVTIIQIMIWKNRNYYPDYDMEKQKLYQIMIWKNGNYYPDYDMEKW